MSTKKPQYTTVLQGTFWYDSPAAMQKDVAEKSAAYTGTLEVTTTLIAWPWHIRAPERYLYRIQINQLIES